MQLTDIMFQKSMQTFSVSSFIKINKQNKCNSFSTQAELVYFPSGKMYVYEWNQYWSPAKIRIQPNKSVFDSA